MNSFFSFSKKSILAQDMLYEKIQKKNLDVMGPLGKLLQSLEQAKREGEYSTVVLEDLLRFAQQSVLLVDQTRITASCHRRVSVLNGVISTLSQTKSELFQKEHKDLFGKEFRDQISESIKVHKHSKELLASDVFKNPPSGNRQFRKGPQQNQSKLRRVYNSSNKKQSYLQQLQEKNYKNQGKYDSQKINLFQADSISASNARVTIPSRTGKEALFTKNSFQK